MEECATYFPHDEWTSKYGNNIVVCDNSKHLNEYNILRYTLGMKEDTIYEPLININQIEQATINSVFSPSNFKYKVSPEAVNLESQIQVYLNCFDCRISETQFDTLKSVDTLQILKYIDVEDKKIKNIRKQAEYQYSNYIVPAIRKNPYIYISKENFINDQILAYNSLRRGKINNWIDVINKGNRVN